MKQKAAVKYAVDTLMSIAMFLLMGYHFWGEATHEWIGTVMFMLFIARHILNGAWHKNILRGKYSAFRILTLCLDLFLLFSMLAQMYSCILMSRHVFDFKP